MIVPHILDVEPNIALNLGLAAGALVLAVGTYHLVENPARNQPWAKAKARRGLAAGLALSSLAVLVAQAGVMRPPQLAKGAPAVDTAKVVAAAADPEAELQRIIAASASTGKLPVNTVPTVQNARRDRPDHYQAGCHLEYLDTTAPGDCVFGDPAGTRTVYLFGDSHAAHWYPAMDAIAEQRGWKLLVRTKSACHAASVRVFSAALKRDYAECRLWREQVLTEIGRAQPHLVVVSSSANDGNPLLADSGGRLRAPAAVVDPRWADGWTATFRAMTGPRTRVVLIRDTPWPGRDAPECLAEHSHRISRCTAAATGAVALPARQRLVDRAARAAGVRVIDPVPWFCTGSVCPPVVGNLLVWRDDDHITTRYAAMLAPLLAARLPE